MKSKRTRKKAPRKRQETLAKAMRKFLTPEMFKQVRNTHSKRKKPRWDVHPLIYVALMMTWCCGDSLPEIFEAARVAYVITCPKKKRPGKTHTGFAKALSKLPMFVLRRLSEMVRIQIIKRFGKRLYYQGWIPLGVDGSKLDVARTEETEKRLGKTNREGSAPGVYISAIVHLTLGIPWCWRFGKGGKSSERAHLWQMLGKLPKAVLLVADAGYPAYDLMRTMIKKHLHFLIRVTSHATFYTDNMEPLDKFREGEVWYWPETVCDEKNPPLKGRLFRVRKRGCKHDVWLFTNASEEKLSKKLASRFYRWRWENECFFRTYKRTFGKVKLRSRMVRTLHREAEMSMLATQLLLCIGAIGTPAPKGAAIPVMCSPRRVLLAIRAEMTHGGKRRSNFAKRLAAAERERRKRKSAKAKRQWATRAKHKPPKPPFLLHLTPDRKSLLQQYLQAA